MGLDELAAGLEITHEQRERGVASVDRRTAPLEDRLSPFADELPCSPADAAIVLEHYAAGASVGASARAAALPPMTAAKTLHRLGETVTPATPTARAVIRDWIAGDLSRTEAETLARLSPAEFALATYVETHDPIPGARAAVEGVLTVGGDAASLEHAAFGDALEDPDF